MYGQPGVDGQGQPGYAPQQPGWMQASSPSTQIPFSAQELPYYQQLYGMADPEGRGFIDGASGEQFLCMSGLSRPLLGVIWSIADSSNQGSLNREQFFAALRLVAHAQAGREPSQELSYMEPPQLPEFEGLERRRGDGEVSEISRPASVVGGLSDTSELQPVIAGTGDQVRQAAEYARQASPSPQPRPFDRSRWAPTRRELRKYASLFIRNDWKKNGVVEAAEAKMLLERARLDTTQLAIAWEHADRDCDGCLTFPEFVALIHLISCIKRGATIPGLQEGLPAELLDALVNLRETPEELASQRSRSTSPVASGRASPTAFLTTSRPVSPAPHHANVEAAWPSSANDAQDMGVTGDFGTAVLEIPEAGGMGFDGFGMHADDDGFGKKSKKKKKDRRSTNMDEPLDAFAPPPAVRDDFRDDFGAQATGLEAPFDAFETQPRKSGRPDRSREQEDRGHDLAMEQSRSSEIDSASKNFAAVIEADRAVSRQLRGEVDLHEGELRQVREAHEQLDRQVRQELQQAESLSEERRRLERQLDNSKHRLAGLRENRRAVNLESISLRRDRDHFATELAFLHKMAIEEENTLQALLHTNSVLNKSYKSMEGQTEQLERQRRELVTQVTAERDLIRQEERHNAEIRTRLERLRREQAADLKNRREEVARTERRNEMQSGMESTAAMASRLVANPSYLPTAGKNHSWAFTLAGSGAAAMAAGGPHSAPQPLGSAGNLLAGQVPIGSQSPMRQLVSAGPSSREGV